MNPFKRQNLFLGRILITANVETSLNALKLKPPGPARVDWGMFGPEIGGQSDCLA